jgi:signal peptidase I
MLALVVGAMAVLTTTLPGRFGYSAVVVTDGSMRPAVLAGDLVILRRRVAGSTVAVGDVVGVRSSAGDGLALRRVVAAQGVDGRLYLQTRADASAAADSDLRAPDQVAGVVVLTLPRLGWLLRATTTAPASYLLIWLPLALLTGQEAREFIREMRWGAAPVGGRFDPRAFDSNSEKLRLGADALRARLAGESRRARARVRRAYPTRSSRRGAASTSEIASPSWNS